jgi:NADPH:quinone reductase-like Zn-dependent oxidoreductase
MATMRAVTVARHGPPSVLELRSWPDPEPGPGEVRIAVAAAGLNFAELSARQGIYPDAPPPPCIVGYECAGVINRVGSGVTLHRPGDRVLGMCRFGGQAELVVVPERQAVPLPPGKDFVEAAALPVTYLTAHHALFQIGTVHPGSTVLVHSAAGGVGVAAVQLLRTVEGVRIVGTSSPGKHDFLREIGCDVALSHADAGFEARAREAMGGRGADILLDAHGGSEWRRSWRLLAPAGRMVAFGVANAHAEGARSLFRVLIELAQMLWVTPLSAMATNRSLQGVNMGTLWTEQALLAPQIERIVKLWAEGVLNPKVHAVVPFVEAARAHEMLERRENRGKVVLVPGSP